MEIGSKIKRSFFQYTITAIYFAVLLAECYFLYNRNYYTRVYVRPFLMPILMLVYIQQIISRNHLLLIAAMIAACLADTFTIRFVVFHQWMGLGLYALSFFMMAILFFKLEWFSFKTSKLALFISLVGLLTYIGIMEYFINSRNLLISNVNVIFIYAGCLALLSLAVLNIYFNNKTYNFTFAVVAVGLLILGNISFESSLFVFHRRHTSVDVITAFCYGLYQFIMVGGIIKVRDKIMGADYFTHE
ncbi:hypothetical protein [Parasediminibacterium sp. JCM 36343]|uniref:hypothetical protein n=1 Tax=Parasediminibacterium sp. JCM 36343 TaxID=3374279 RepID=UPI00397C2324